MAQYICLNCQQLESSPEDICCGSPDLFAVNDMPSEIKRLRAELAEEARVNGMGAERELKLKTQVEDLQRSLAAMTADRDHWKSNHETEVRRARILKERPDMPVERIQAYEAWMQDQEKLMQVSQERNELAEKVSHLLIDKNA